MLNQISGRITYLPYEEETDRPNLGYIRGDESALMVDAGNSVGHAKKIMEELSKNGLRRPDFVVLTHHHWDHSYGLHAVGGISIANEKTNKHLHEMALWSWSGEEFERHIFSNELPLFCKEHILKEYRNFEEKIIVKAADIAFSGQMELDLGGVHCVIMEIPSPHTDDCTAVYCKEEKILFLGDANCEEVIGTQWVDHKEELGQLIETLEKIDFNACLLGHWVPLGKTELLEGLKERYAAL